MVNEKIVVTVINLADNSVLVQQQITADSAIVHPSDNFLASRDGRVLQIFNLENMLTFRSQIIEEDVVFWKWISETTIGIVTEASVYHWSFRFQSQVPDKIFDRDPNLAGAQIVNYRATFNEEWLVLVGISSNSTDSSAFKVRGTMQLYNQRRRISRVLHGHAASFAELQLDGQQSVTKLFTYAVRSPTNAKFHVVEIEQTAPDSSFGNKATDLHFLPEAVDDFPVAVQSAECLYMNHMSWETIIVAAELGATHGLIAVNQRGQVLSVSINEQTIVRYIRTMLDDATLALKLATRANLPGAEDLHVPDSRQKGNQEKHDLRLLDAHHISSKITRLERNVQELRDRLAMSQLAVANHEKTIEHLRSQLAASQRTIGEEKEDLTQTIHSLRTRDERSNKIITQLYEVNQELRFELSESQRKVDKLLGIIRAREEKQQREFLYSPSPGRVHDAAESLLEIANSAREDWSE